MDNIPPLDVSFYYTVSGSFGMMIAFDESTKVKTPDVKEIQWYAASNPHTSELQEWLTENDIRASVSVPMCGVLNNNKIQIEPRAALILENERDYTMTKLRFGLVPLKIVDATLECDTRSQKGIS